MLNFVEELLVCCIAEFSKSREVDLFSKTSGIWLCDQGRPMAHIHMSCRLYVIYRGCTLEQSETNLCKLPSLSLPA